MSKQIARKLRKLADFFDPSVPPSDESVITIRIDADTRDAEEKIVRLIGSLETARGMMDDAKVND